MSLEKYRLLVVKKINKEILCFSGGIDSVVALHKLNFPQTIYVNMEHKYQNKEHNCIGALKKIIPQLKNIIFFNGPELGQFEEGAKAYISKRNFHLALCASHFGNHIYIIGNNEDIFDDNNKNAYNIMSLAMNETQSPKEPTITIESPFWDWSKTDIIEWFKENYEPDYVENVLKTSKSCYNESTTGQCGACESCRRKYIALWEAGFTDCWKWFEQDIRKYKNDCFK